jgi:hypothetical protein
MTVTGHRVTRSQTQRQGEAFFISTPVKTKAQKSIQRQIKQDLLKKNPETLNYDHQGEEGCPGLQTDVQFFTTRTPLWKQACLAFYNTTYRLGKHGKPIVNPNPKATVEQLCVPKLNEDEGKYISFSYFSTGIILVQGEEFLSFAENFNQLKDRVEEASSVLALAEEDATLETDTLSVSMILSTPESAGNLQTSFQGSETSDVSEMVTESMLPAEEPEDSSVALRQAQEQLLLTNQQLQQARDELQSQKSDNKTLKLQRQLRDEDIGTQNKEIVELKSKLKTMATETNKLKNVREALCREKLNLKTKNRQIEEGEETMRVMVDALQNRITQLEDENNMLRTQAAPHMPEQLDSSWTTVPTSRQRPPETTMVNKGAEPRPSPRASAPKPAARAEQKGQTIKTAIGLRPTRKTITDTTYSDQRRRDYLRLTGACQPGKTANCSGDRYLQKRVTVVGSSTLRGTGSHMKLDEHDTCVMVNPGAKIENMTQKVKTQCGTEDIVVLHCGGNNMETDSLEDAQGKYEHLLESVAKSSPGARIIISGVPQRQHVRSYVQNNIRQLNVCLKDRAAREPERLYFLDNSNISQEYLRRDGVHLTAEGRQLLGQNIAAAVRHVAKDMDFPVLSSQLRG